MRVVVFVKASKESEEGQMPTEQELAEMGRFNEELVNEGVMLSGEGLHPTSRGARVRYNGSERMVIDGPFAETKELVAGFWMLKVDSWEHALSIARRVPFREGEVEIRRVFEAEDFGDEFTPELREAEENLRARIEARQ